MLPPWALARVIPEAVEAFAQLEQLGEEGRALVPDGQRGALEKHLISGYNHTLFACLLQNTQ